MKITFEFNGKETFVTVRKWEKHGLRRMYISDDRDKPYGHIDMATGIFHWKENVSTGWIAAAETAIRAAI